MKKCPKCGIIKEDSEFYVEKSGRRKGKLTSWCKSCCSERTKERRRKNPEKVNAEHLEWARKNKEKVAFTKAKSAYGITKEEYDNLKRVCQICGSTENLVIDHSHQSGRIRGMLCNSCNKGLGFFRDNPCYLSRASDYVLGQFEEIDEPQKPDVFAKKYELIE